MALAAETLTGPSGKSPICSISADKTTKTHRRPPLFGGDILSKLYTTPLMVLHFALYGATPFYYLLHYSPFRSTEDGVGDDAFNQTLKWTLLLMTQYITAVIVVSWSGRYQAWKNMAVCAYMVAGLGIFSWLRAWVSHMAVSAGDDLGRALDGAG